MKITFLKAIPWPGKGWRIQWSIQGIEPSDEIILERSSAPEGPWDLIATLPFNDVTYQDEWATNRSLFSERYYRLRIGDLESVPVCSKNRGGLITNEIIRQHELVLKGVNAHPGYMSRHFACFKRTMQGTKCYYCRDEHTDETLVSQCDICMGTGYIEGWSNPIKFFGRWTNQVQKMTSLTNREQEEDNRMLFTAAYPILEPGDVLAEKGTGKVYRIKNISSVEPDDIIISQNATCSIINRDFVESKLRFPE